jgi:hypothetical protein
VNLRIPSLWRGVRWPKNRQIHRVLLPACIIMRRGTPRGIGRLKPKVVVRIVKEQLRGIKRTTRGGQVLGRSRRTKYEPYIIKYMLNNAEYIHRYDVLPPPCAPPFFSSSAEAFVELFPTCWYPLAGYIMMWPRGGKFGGRRHISFRKQENIIWKNRETLTNYSPHKFSTSSWGEGEGFGAHLPARAHLGISFSSKF